MGQIFGRNAQAAVADDVLNRVSNKGLFMTTTTNSSTANYRVIKLATFLLSLLFGIMGGGVIISAVWFPIAKTDLVTHLGTALAITEKTPWYLSRSAGTVAYLLLLGSTVWGLLLSTRIISETVPAALALAMHNILSWLSITFTGIHALALILDNYFSYTLFDLTIPFTGPNRPGWISLGIIAFYLMLLTSTSFRFRKQLGQKRWRRLHYLTFAVFIMTTAHGIAAGTDSGKPGMQILYLVGGLQVFFLSCYRLLARNPEPVRQHQSTIHR